MDYRIRSGLTIEYELYIFSYVINFNNFFFRFIGELFKKRIRRTTIMQCFIANLTSQKSESSLECLCSLLKTTGKKLEQVRLYPLKKKKIMIY